MDHHVLPGNPPLSVVLRRSRGARRLSLRVSRLDGRAVLTMPHGVAPRVVTDFLQEKEAWLRKHTSGALGPIAIGLGAELPVLGRPLRVVAAEGRGIRQVDGLLHLGGDPVTAGVRVRAWLRELARDRLGAASDGYASALGRSYTRLTLRDTRSRWGSCTSDGGLMYSWRLVMAPPEVLDYVAAHEVAHLAEMNHSPAFWRVVQDLFGDYEAPRQWLRQHGHDLHRYRFEN
jgi:predicted metal-dependent hydrolase